MPQQELNLLQLAALRSAADGSEVVADRAAPAPRFRSVAHTRVPAARPRAPLTRSCPLGRSRARAGRSVLSLSLPRPATHQSLASPTAAPPPTASCFPSPGNPETPM